ASPRPCRAAPPGRGSPPVMEDRGRRMAIGPRDGKGGGGRGRRDPSPPADAGPPMRRPAPPGRDRDADLPARLDGAVRRRRLVARPLRAVDPGPPLSPPARPVQLRVGRPPLDPPALGLPGRPRAVPPRR